MLARTELDAEGEVLIQAADFLEANQWYHPIESPLLWTTKRYCIMNAISAVSWAIDPELRLRSYDRVAKYLGLGHRHQAVGWNDHPSRTKEQVVEALRNAAYYRE